MQRTLKCCLYTYFATPALTKSRRALRDPWRRVGWAAQSWADVYYFCGADLQYCTCEFTWNARGWGKAFLLWNFVLTAALVRSCTRHLRACCSNGHFCQEVRVALGADEGTLLGAGPAEAGHTGRAGWAACRWGPLMPA